MYDLKKISGKEARETLEFLFDAAVDIEMENDHDRFLEKVLSYSRGIFNAPGGSLYLKKDASMEFISSQNDEIDISLLTSAKEKTSNISIPISHKSIAGHVALSGETLYIKDPYKLPKNAPYSFNTTVDTATGYKTKSILAIPMRHPAAGIIGTLEIINLESQSYQKYKVGIAKSFAVIASVSVINMQLREALRRAYLETLVRLGTASEFKDEETYNHIQRMRDTSKILARKLGYSEQEQENIFYASAMHDIGKIGIPDSILNKPGKLTKEEWNEMRTHCAKGASILEGSETDILKLSENIALNHHEKWNGKGYPNGTKGNEIPLEGRIVAIADVFDALVNERPYKKAWPLQDAIDLIKSEKGKHFDPMVVDAFIDCLDEIIKVQDQFSETIKLSDLS